ncbi:uncharacterized protein EKO05_0010570 [Ascochyta rabiei]|nr:uncharacterized protein EKO05_0010570 [Ascochyta rabiei]UPX20335.1 hypothetical protein EKO05_0010570 [Ascochyta rabiei]
MVGFQDAERAFFGALHTERVRCNGTDVGAARVREYKRAGESRKARDSA